MLIKPGRGILFTDEECFRQVRRYLELAAFNRVIGNLQYAAGFLNSAHHWRRRWQWFGGDTEREYDYWEASKHG